jgi:hypothetical protein
MRGAVWMWKKTAGWRAPLCQGAYLFGDKMSQNQSNDIIQKCARHQLPF